ncbi:MAG: hypothetical protein LUI39_02565 [Lachnospiraceae bacterium]|nr:hypothetical protein [Lachnospiraceae bacterium]
MIKIGVMNKGDEVLGVTNDFIAIRRRKGDVDIIPLLKDCFPWQIDTANIINIGYGKNIVTMETEDEVSVSSF